MGGWQQLDGAARQADVWDRNTFAVVNASNEVYSRRGGAWVREPGTAKHITYAGGW
jgi:hypothetical protein